MGSATESVRSLLLASLVWVGAGVAACSDEAKAPPAAEDTTFTEGKRLKAVYRQADGAPPLFLNWYDTTLGVDCTFVDVGLPDGRLACFPSEPVGAGTYNLFAAETGNLFADSGCTEPLVAAVFTPCASRFFARGPALDAACGTPVHLYPVGAPVGSDPASFFSTGAPDDGSCRPATSSDVGWANELHRLGPEIPLDTLVTGTYRHATGPARIVPVEIVGSDGSLQIDVALAWDTERNETVSIGAPGDRWFPAAPYETGNLFANATCTAPAAIGSACAAPAREAVESDFDECGQYGPVRFFELGARLPESAHVYFDDSVNDSCALYPGGWDSPNANPAIASFSVGAPVPTTAFAAATVSFVGSGQLRIPRAAAAGGPAAVDGRAFFDSVHGQPCTIAPGIQAADGVVRCLPEAVTESPFFADAACTVQLVMLDRAPGPCAPVKPAFFATTEAGPTPTDGCTFSQTSRRHMFAVGDDPFTGSLYYGIAGGDGLCLEIGDTSSFSPGTLYAVGPESPPSDFATATYVRPN